MLLHARDLKVGDYEDILVGWWTDWGFAPPVKEFLPDNATGGLIVYDGDIPVCAGFLYETNSLMAWSEWIISNKEYRGKGRKDAVSLLLKGIEDLARDKGFRFIFANNNNSSLIKHYVDNGYSVGQSDSTEIIKVI